MPLLALGINHKTAPLDIRERVSFAPDRLQEALAEAQAKTDTSGLAIFSTCNRTEIYCQTDSVNDLTMIEWMSEYHGIPASEFLPYLYKHPDQRAVRHLMRVASGLDSLVLGEPQILGQVKTAYQDAKTAGTLGTNLERMFQHVFSVAKQVRTDTSIGASAVSVAFAAVTLAKQIFPDLPKRTALLIGAGETTELVARHMHESGIGRIIVANRTFSRAHQLASQFQGYAIALDELEAHLQEADIIVSSTASPDLIVHYQQLRDALRKRRHQPVFLVDLAVPRDLDPKIATLDDAYLYSVDDLEGIIQENLKSRQEAARQAEEIIDVQVQHFMGWLKAQSATASIRRLRDQATDIRDKALEDALKKIASGKPVEEVLKILANTLTNKLIHAPSAGLREAALEGRNDVVDTLRSVYKLEEPKT